MPKHGPHYQRYIRRDNILRPLASGERRRYDPNAEMRHRIDRPHIHADESVEVIEIKPTPSEPIGLYRVEAQDGCRFYAAPWELV